MTSKRLFLVGLLGAALWLCYWAAFALGDLRVNTIQFVIIAALAFGLYLAAVALVLRPAEPVPVPTWATLLVIGVFAILFRLTLLPTWPTLSDDMFRYVWDGRVQAAGLSPYRYPPNAQQVADLHRIDHTIWPAINRKEAVTVYPPGAQLAYAFLWRIVGDSITGYKLAFVVAELLGGILLINLLQHFGQPPERVLIYLWSPLLVFEVAQAGHVDGLMLPFLILAFWARAKDKPGWLGLSLGAATLIKLFPVLLLPALLPLPSLAETRRNWRSLGPAFKTVVMFAVVVAVCYAFYVFRPGPAVGFLPQYFNENFNLGLARPLFDLADYFKWPKSTFVNLITFGGLIVIGVGCLLKPAASAREALVRCIWLMGWFTLFTQNLFAWYLLWLLPLLTLFIEPGWVLGLRLTPVTAWLIFSGTILLSYLFFIRWRVVAGGQLAEYLPLYGLLIAAWARAAAPTLWRIPLARTQGALQ